MTAPGTAEARPPAKQDPEALVLRGRPSPAIRFRKSVIVGTSGVLVAALVGLAWIALEPPALRSVVAGDDTTGPSAATPEALAGAPRSYGEVPRLGPPLPGDLGRPILERQRQLEAESAEGSLAPQRDGVADGAAAERQRALAEEQSARSSGVLVQRAGTDSVARRLEVPGASGAAEEKPGAAAVAEQGPGYRRIAFAQSAGASFEGRTGAPAGPLLAAGTIIPASLLTGLNSELPGTVIAQVTENVRDSVTGNWVLIPQGARLIGSYDSRTSYGQKRALLVWQRLLLPDGSSIELDKMPATDAGGYAGIRDRVDGHGWEVLKGVFLASLLGVGSELGTGGGGPLERALREALQQNGSQAGEQIVGRGLDIQPTLTVRPGWPVRVLVTRDLPLPPWKGASWPR